MFRKSVTIPFLLAVLAAGRTDTARAASRLDADTIAAALQTADPNEIAYITYLVTLLDQGRLSRALVDGTFQWIRRKPFRHKKFQYFKQALITRAARIGISLPRGTPDLTPTINGRVVLRVLLVDVPCPNIDVTIRGTRRKTVTDENGEFSFANVPYGRYTLDASGIVLFLLRTGSANVTLPPTPPSTDSTFVEIRVY